jgi:hypothetical protein
MHRSQSRNSTWIGPQKVIFLPRLIILFQIGKLDLLLDPKSSRPLFSLHQGLLDTCAFLFQSHSEALSRMLVCVPMTGNWGQESLPLVKGVMVEFAGNEGCPV